MALALPDGYVDTGHSGSFTVGCSVKLWLHGPPVSARINEWEIQGSISFEEAPECSGVELFAWIPIVLISLAPDDSLISTALERSVTCWRGEEEDLNEDGILDATPMPAAHWSGGVAFEETTGPFRLGVREELIDEEADLPHLWTNRRLHYAWFADRDTQITTSMGGHSVGPRYYNPSASPGWDTEYPEEFEPVLVEPGELDFGGTLQGAGVPEIEFSGLPADCSDLSTSRMHGSGSTVSMQGSAGSENQSILPGHTIEYDLDLPGFGTGTSSGVSVHSDRGYTRTVPYTGTEFYRSVSWAADGYHHEAFDLVTEGTEVYPLADAPVQLWCAPPRLDPGAAFESYTPVTVAFADDLDVLRPDGEAPTAFASSDAEKIVVTDGDENVAITAALTGGSIIRTLGASGTDAPEWRPKLGVGASGHADPAFHPDNAHTTKHSPGSDIYDWSGFRYLRLSLNVLLGGDQHLTLRVRGVHLAIEDPHTTGSDRRDDFSVTEIPYEYVYSGLTFAAGTSDVDVDLCFPDAGGPQYHGRVDAIEISGWTPGSFLLTGLKLISKAPKSVWLKHALGAPVSRGDYSSLHASHNGANFSLNLGDQANKPEEIGAHGGGLRYIDPLTGSGTGLTLDTVKSLQAYWGQLDAVEGWTVTWNAAAEAAALADDFGNAFLSTAEWARQRHASFNAGAADQPAAHPVVRYILPARGRTFAWATRMWVGGAAEAILSTGAEPVPNTDQSFAGVSATSDAHGYIHWYAVDAGSAIPGHGGNLTPRDKPRILVTIEGDDEEPLGGVDLAETPEGWIIRAARQNGLVLVDRSRNAGISWDPAQTVMSTASEGEDEIPGAAPTLAVDAGGRLWTWVHDAGGAAKGYYSADRVGSWSGWATHAGKLFPRAVFQLRRMLLVAHVGSALEFYESADSGLTLTHLPGLSLAAPAQLAALAVDRRDRVHVVYVSGGALLHRYLEGDTWSSPETLAASGAHPSYSPGIRGALLLYWVGETLAAALTDETYGGTLSPFTAPSGLTPGLPVGVVTRERQHLYASGWGAGPALITRYTRDPSVAWSTPA